ncbi:uncharacterized protein L199_002780 [Kwoniella botswanensis]|uniref:uncharacterized protein n=1 Tax=Kwoniella botswanensis TaxID=1268659 RepID=UPI00315C9EAD
MPHKRAGREKETTPTSTTTATSQSARADLSDRKAFAWRHKSGNIYGTFFSRSSDGAKVGIYSVGDIIVQRDIAYQGLQTDILPSYAMMNLHRSQSMSNSQLIEVPTAPEESWKDDRIPLTVSGESAMIRKNTWPEEIKSLVYEWKSQPSAKIGGFTKSLYLDKAELRSLQKTTFIPVTEENYTLINGRPGTGHEDRPARRAPIEYQWGGAHTWYQFSVPGLASSSWTDEDIRELHPTEKEIDDLLKGMEDVTWFTISVPTRSDHVEV